ncbi:type I-C CRISPR-associated endonuclease Cas1 [Methylosinus sp. H3A]|uniref:type I-C CRISPR-associated endonuclease Cas1c n=1 Tax=Methylosinus sp. H3A TaxID=2785786 RepID=UPI0018C22988|nr:type I-C CRISPR-associated endonuclease Cas1c [Methylosinus sp. H3A]MBG0808222.1 type I-C CRISPR-associated endonuclease Cas1 [Methylosinus sp. H3A]
MVDRRHLNTLYVSTEGAYVRKDGENAVVEVDGGERLRVPLHKLGSIAPFGRVTISTGLMAAAVESGIAITHFSDNGRFLARVEGPVSGNVLLRRDQFRVHESEAASANFAAVIIIAKASNQRAVLQRALRDHGDGLDQTARDALHSSVEHLADAARRCLKPRALDEVRGVEGEAARAYFGVFDHLICVKEPGLRFGARSRRPPLDAVNALLSFLYTLLAHDCRSALEGVGLDPAVGFLHRLRPGRPSLALDLMEELRPHLADRLALINRGEIGVSDFRLFENGAVLLNDDARKQVLVAFQERKREEIEHPFLKEKLAIGLLPHIQARLLAKAVRGDLDGYPPMIWK